MLGGRTAELIIFNEFSTGAQNDLLRATDIARAMVTEFGMSEAIGQSTTRAIAAARSSKRRMCPSAGRMRRRPRE
jgi:ATP-dependent Zn protease